MQSRLVLFGHSAFFDSSRVELPENTSITFYAPEGALLDSNIAKALANGELIETSDLMPVKFPIQFLAKAIIPVNFKLTDEHLLGDYPRTYYAGDTLPNYLIGYATALDQQPDPLRPVASEVLVMKEVQSLEEILNNNKGRDIHWAGCSFSYDSNETSIGYGYGYKFKTDSQLKSVYDPEIILSTDELRKQRRARFGITEDQTPDVSATTDTNQPRLFGANRRIGGVTRRSTDDHRNPYSHHMHRSYR